MGRRIVRILLVTMLSITMTAALAPAGAATGVSADNAAAPVFAAGTDDAEAAGTDGTEASGTPDSAETGAAGADQSGTPGENGADQSGDGPAFAPAGEADGAGTPDADGEAGEGQLLEQAAAPWTPEDGLPAMGKIKVTVLNSSQLLVNWEANETFDGYQVSYARNVLFLRAKTKKVKSPAANNLTLDGLKTGKRYYVRVRGYKEYGGDLYCSDWVRTKTSKDPANVSIKFMSTGGKKVDIRQQAGSALNGYSISQGTCSDGKHLYMAFEKRNGDDNGSKRARIKIAKVRISDWKLLKVSSSGQKLGHANDITYNSNQKILVVTGAKTNDPYVRIVSPSTLKKTGTKRVRLGTKYKRVKAFNAIDYEPDSHTYYIRSRNYGGVSFTLNEDFQIMDAATMLTVFPKRHVQSCTSIGDFFIIAQSWYQSTKKNTLTIFSKSGEKLQHITLKLSGELESLFFIGDKLYATVHKHVNRHYSTGYIFQILF